MKKKLTLSVEEETVKYAKRLAKRYGKSVSQMFEEKFKEENTNTIQTEPQKSASKLLIELETSEKVQTKQDKALIKEHVKRKFA